jgi:hypothetical protein
MGILVPNIMEEAMIYLFLWKKFHHFLIKKIPKKHGQGNFLQKFQKKSSHFNEENYEMAKVFKKFR